MKRRVRSLRGCCRHWVCRRRRRCCRRRWRWCQWWRRLHCRLCLCRLCLCRRRLRLRLRLRLSRHLLLSVLVELSLPLQPHELEALLLELPCEARIVHMLSLRLSLRCLGLRSQRVRGSRRFRGALDARAHGNACGDGGRRDGRVIVELTLDLSLDRLAPHSRVFCCHDIRVRLLELLWLWLQLWRRRRRRRLRMMWRRLLLPPPPLRFDVEVGRGPRCRHVDQPRLRRRGRWRPAVWRCARRSIWAQRRCIAGDAERSGLQVRRGCTNGASTRHVLSRRLPLAH